MSDRLRAAQGLRKGLELWPDANHWCQDQLEDTAEDGTKQRCTFQMLCDGLGVSTWFMASNSYSDSPLFKIAEAEIMRVAQARGANGAEGTICTVNNSNDFATVKNIVEEAATNLEKVQ